jgi:hypothetical protein
MMLSRSPPYHAGRSRGWRNEPLRLFHGPIKIGCSEVPMERLRVAQCSPFLLELIGSVPGDLNDELRSFIGDRYQHMHMVGQYLPFLDLAFPAPSKLTQYAQVRRRPQLPSASLGLASFSLKL